MKKKNSKTFKPLKTNLLLVIIFITNKLTIIALFVRNIHILTVSKFHRNNNFSRMQITEPAEQY